MTPSFAPNSSHVTPRFAPNFVSQHLYNGEVLFNMSDSPQNILREAADRLIQTAEHLGRVASLTSANYASSSVSETSSVVASASGNAINSSANSAPPIASSAASEHARLFGYRPPAACNVRSNVSGAG